MRTQSAFWREVLDYIPQLLLLFRVDEQENAHLIFANREISNYLGYTAKEYVLESEKQSKIDKELNKLIDEIARRSHDVEDIKPEPCRLSAKDGEEYKFNIDFRLFKTSSKKSNLILVLLQRATSVRERAYRERLPEEPRKKPDEQTEKSLQPVIASPIIKAAVEKARELFESSQNILLVGEQGVGKKTLAEYLLDPTDIHPTATVFQRDDFIRDGITFEEDKQVVVYLPAIDILSKSEQQKLSNRLAELESQDIKITCIATSNTLLEEAVSNGEFDANLYYEFAFSNILIPPLQQRKEDIKAVAKHFMADAEQTLHFDNITVDDKEFEKLIHHEWSKNFHELFEVLFESLCRAQDGIVEFKLATRRQSDLFPEENIDPGDILPFEEMNRRYLARILEITSGKIYGEDGAANLIDLKPTTLQSKLKKLGLR